MNPILGVRSPRPAGARMTLALASIVTMLTLAGCGPAASSPVASASPLATLSAPPTASASASAPPSSAVASPSSNLVLPHDDPALEARLPDEFEGKTLFKISVGPVSSAGNPGAEPIKDLVDEIGDSTGNFSLAFANDPTDPTYNYFALQIPGAPSAQLVDRYAALTVADTRGAEIDEGTVGGKGVTHVTAPGNPIGDVWFYAIDDTLFGVQAASADDAAALLTLLP